LRGFLQISPGARMANARGIEMMDRIQQSLLFEVKRMIICEGTEIDPRGLQYPDRFRIGPKMKDLIAA